MKQLNHFKRATIGLCLAICAAATPGAARAAEITVCGGPDGGNYQYAVTQFHLQSKDSFTMAALLTTKGSMDNLELIAAGKCDAAIVQSDAYTVFMKTHVGATLSLERGRSLYPEYVHLVCNKAAGLSKITGLKKGMTLLTGPNGGGASVTWDFFKLADPDRYDGEKNGPATLPIGGDRALGKIQEGSDAQCYIYVGGLKSAIMMDADKLSASNSGRLELVPTNDSDVAKILDPKKKRVYADTSIAAGTYPLSFQTRSLAGSSVNALAVDAILVTNTDYIDAHEAIYNKFLKAVNAAMPAVLEHVQGGR